MKHYMLAGHDVVPCADMLAWVNWFGPAGDEARRVGLDIIDGHEVSTVFMGLDTNPQSTVPRGVFETRVVLATGESAIVAKYSAWVEAQVGHTNIVGRLQQHLTGAEATAQLMARLRLENT